MPAQLQGAVDKALAKHAAVQASRRENSEYRNLIQALTRREQEVLRYIISGRLNKVIAADLNISEKTVKVHRARVLKKMQVRSVAELARICTLVDLEPAAQKSPQQVEKSFKEAEGAPQLSPEGGYGNGEGRVSSFRNIFVVTRTSRLRDAQAPRRVLPFLSGGERHE